MNKYLNPPSLGVLCCFALVAVPRAEAVLQVDVMDANIQVGGTGFVDVVVTGMPDLINGHQLELAITPLGAAGSLQFLSPQVTDYAADASTYVYGADSFNNINALNAKGITGGGFVFSDSDSTNSLADVSIGASATRLARVDLEHIIPGGSDPNLFTGDQFDISVVLANTSFTDSGFATVPFTATSGTISATSAAIPEPSTILLVGTSAGYWFYRRRRRAA